METYKPEVNNAGNKPLLILENYLKEIQNCRYITNNSEKTVQKYAYSNNDAEKKDETVVEEETKTSNADSIMQALNIFENTHNLAETSEEETKEEPPVYSEEEQPEVEESTTVEEEPKAEESETPVVTETSEPVEEKEEETSVEPSGYAAEMNNFKAQLGTDKYNTNSTPYEMSSKELSIHTNSEPINVTSSIDSEEIKKFIGSYVDFDEMPNSKFKEYWNGCQQFYEDSTLMEYKVIDEIKEKIERQEEIEAELEKLEQKIQEVRNNYNNASSEIADSQVKLGQIKADKSMTKEAMERMQAYKQAESEMFTVHTNSEYSENQGRSRAA